MSEITQLNKQLDFIDDETGVLMFAINELESESGVVGCAARFPDFTKTTPTNALLQPTARHWLGANFQIER